MDLTPVPSDLWAGIGGHFDSFAQVVSEFIDNSISNFEGEHPPGKTIIIRIEEDAPHGLVQVTVEDTGTGIPDLEAAFRLGDKSHRMSPLNEHGFGLKHALATANHANDSWAVYTRTKTDVVGGMYSVVRAPYNFHMNSESISIATTPWPGSFNDTGTVVKFECPRPLYDTLRKGIPGGAQFRRCLDYLREELGYAYAGVIENGTASITIKSAAAGYDETVATVQPKWRGLYPPKQGSTARDLGAGTVTIDYHFGEVLPRLEPEAKHYLQNMETSGAEVRLNGRVLLSNVFKEIWTKENHPDYNHFLVTLDLLSPDLSKLPKTRTSKNGIRSGDPKLETLFEWVRSVCPDPPRETSDAVSERELVKQLKKLKDIHIPDPKSVETEFKVYTRLGSPVPVDLYVYDGKNITIYEAKKGNADVQSVYQLMMYWDGLVSDKRTPALGVILASTFSAGVDAVIARLNGMQDGDGHNYNFSKRTWKEEGMNYPVP
jgi:hypothetical protein